MKRQDYHCICLIFLIKLVKKRAKEHCVHISRYHSNMNVVMVVER